MAISGDYFIFYEKGKQRRFSGDRLVSILPKCPQKSYTLRELEGMFKAEFLASPVPQDYGRLPIIAEADSGRFLLYFPENFKFEQQNEVIYVSKSRLNSIAVPAEAFLTLERAALNRDKEHNAKLSLYKSFHITGITFELTAASSELIKEMAKELQIEFIYKHRVNFRAVPTTEIGTNEISSKWLLFFQQNLTLSALEELEALAKSFHISMREVKGTLPPLL